jgi:hypothetical protein
MRSVAGLSVLAVFVVLVGCSGGSGDGGVNPPDVTAPTVPQGLTATATSGTAIGLSWSPSSDDRGVVGYRLYRNGATHRDTAATSVNDTGLTPETRYCYQVLAYDAANNQSGLGAEACATTQVSSTDVTLTVTKAGTGSGTVTGPGISCGTDCSETVASGTSIELTAAAASGSTFASWSGCDTPSGATCTMSMTASKTVTASFSGVTPVHTVAIAQGGNVSVSPAGTLRAYLGETIDLTTRANSSGVVPILLVNGRPVDMARSGDDYLFTLTVAGDTEVYATSAVEPTLSPNAKAVDAATIQRLSSMSAGTLVFEGTTPYLDALRPGDVMMGGVAAPTPYGLLRRVTAITVNGSRVTVETASASIEDVIESGEIIINETLAASNLTSFVPLRAGVSLRQQESLGSLAAAAAELCFSLDQVLWDADGNASTTIDQVVSDGQVCFSADFNFALSVGWFEVNHLTLSTTLGQTVDLSFQTNVGWSFGTSIPVAEFYFGAITAGPLVFVPKLTVYIGADAALSGGISFGVTEYSSATLGLSYDHDNGWNPIARHSTGFSASSRPTYYARASATGYAALEFDFLLYGVAGTYARPKAYVGIELEPAADPWLSVYGGISASAGLKAGILDYTLQHEFGELFDYRETLHALRGNKPPMISSFTASPGTVATQGTSTIAVVASDPENDPFACTWATDGGTLSSTAGCGSVTWTAPEAPGIYRVSISASDDKSGYNPTTRSVSISVPQSLTLTVQKAGNGTGRVTGNHIDCGTTCSETCFYCVSVGGLLIATADPGSTFAGWSGCSSIINGYICEVSSNRNTTVTATFNLVPVPYYLLSVSRSGTGSGTVTGPGIDCGSDCSESLAGSVTLTATPSSGSEVRGWTGCDSFNGSTCTVSMNRDRTVTATFGPLRTLSVQRSGDGSGTLAGGGINCGSTCSVTVSDGTSVTLTATPSSGSVFAGWSGCDSTSGNACTVTMNQNRTVTASFGALYSLSVQEAGSGSGWVNTSPQGRDCGTGSSTCYVSGATVTLTATPFTSSALTSWSGCDSTSGSTCVVTMNQNRTVTATFTLVYHTLSVERTGTGGGTVTGTGINCGSDCSEVYVQGTNVTLTATPGSDSALTGWSGCDSTNGNACTVTSISQGRTITATFSLNVQYYSLSVQRSGTGSGTVTGGGMDCGSTCSLSLAGGTAVTLTATPSTSSSFTSWSGCDSTNGNSCTVTMNQSKTVTATFALVYNTLTIRKGGCGTGTVTGPGIDCGSTCTGTVTRGTTVTLGSNPDSGSVSAGMYRGTSRLYPENTLTVLGDVTVSALFGLQAYNVCVQPAGTGSGIVRTSDSMHISCAISSQYGISGTCSGNLPTTGNFYTTLYATPASGSSFGGWTGPCYRTGTDYSTNPARYWCETIWIGSNGFPFEAFIATFN